MNHGPMLPHYAALFEKVRATQCVDEAVEQWLTNECADDIAQMAKELDVSLNDFTKVVGAFIRELAHRCTFSALEDYLTTGPPKSIVFTHQIKAVKYDPASKSEERRHWDHRRQLAAHRLGANAIDLITDHVIDEDAHSQTIEYQMIVVVPEKGKGPAA